MQVHAMDRQGGDQLRDGHFPLTPDDEINLGELAEDFFTGVAGIDPAIDRPDARDRLLDLATKVQRIRIGDHRTRMTDEDDLGTGLNQALNHLRDPKVPCVRVNEGNLMPLVEEGSSQGQQAQRRKVPMPELVDGKVQRRNDARDSHAGGLAQAAVRWCAAGDKP